MRETKDFVARTLSQGVGRVFTPTEREVVANDPQSQRGRNLRSAKYLAEHIAEVPVMIFACVKKYTDRARAGISRCGARSYPAIQNLCLAARGYGLGTSITGMHTMFAKEIDAMLGVPPEYANVVADSDGLSERSMGAARPQASAAGDNLGTMGQARESRAGKIESARAALSPRSRRAPSCAESDRRA